MDRQIGKQCTAERVVDKLNPEARISLKDMKTLICDDEDDPPAKDYSQDRDCQVAMNDTILEIVLQRSGGSFTKYPFQHDTLLAEGIDAPISEEEKRNAMRDYEKVIIEERMQRRLQTASLASQVRQGKLAMKEMILPETVVVHCIENTRPQVVPVGTKVTFIKHPKGIFMRTWDGKIFSVQTE